MIQIYALSDPRTSDIRYVGKAVDAKRRLRSHLSVCGSRDTPLYRWMRDLVASGLCPTVSVLHECDESEWRAAERRLIADARTRFPDLLNVTAGGDEPGSSLETRARNGASVARQRTADPRAKRIYEIKRSVGQMLKDGVLTERHKQRMREVAAKAPHIFGKWADV